MLQFIVLGLIPGTHIVITFFGVLGLLVFIMGGVTAHVMAHDLFSEPEAAPKSTKIKSTAI